MSDNTFDLSKRMFTVVIIFLAGLVLFWGFRMYEIWNNANGNYPREISVEATGKAYIVPDIAMVSLGLYTEGDTSTEVVAENNKKMTAIIAVIKELGIDEKDIKTTSYYLSPRYNYTDARGSFEDGFTLDQTIEVKIRDLNKVGDVVSKAAEAGANITDNVYFTVEDSEKAKTEARTEALKNVKEKAEMIAQQAGLRLGKVLSYYEYSDEDGKSGVYYDEAVTEESYSAPISPGQQEINLTVTLSYRLK